MLEYRRMLSGVTLIAHGFGSDANPDGWVREMGRAIIDRAGIPEANEVFFTAVGSEDSIGFSASYDYRQSPETIVYVDWSAFAGSLFSGDTWASIIDNNAFPAASTTAVASALLPYLLETGFPETDSSLVSDSIHLIGHSRGGSLVSELSRLLAEKGVWVDQLTTLDPHPVDGIDEPSGSVGLQFAGYDLIRRDIIPDFNDAPANVYSNVVFADNYWRRDDFVDVSLLQSAIEGTANFATDALLGAFGLGAVGSLVNVDFQIDDSGLLDFAGQPITGASNVQLDEATLEGTSLDPGYTWPYGGEHSDTHLWYYGTIANSGTLSDGNASVSDPSSWYSGTAYASIPADVSGDRVTTGFYFSRIGGGERPSSGLSQDFGGMGARTVVAQRGAEWANIGYLNLSQEVATRGGPLSINYYYDAPTSHVASVQFYLDHNQNPYDGGLTPLYSQILPASSVTTSTAAFTVPSNASDGTYYVVAKITDVNTDNYRYAYSQERLTIDGELKVITASAGPHGSISPNGSVDVAVGGSQAFTASPDSGYVVDAWYYNDPNNPAQVGGTTFVASDVQDDGWVNVAFRQQRSSELVVERPAVNPYSTGESSVWFSGTAPTGTHHVTWQNTTTGSDGNTGDDDIGSTFWDVRISVDAGANSIVFKAWGNAAETQLLATTDFSVERSNNVHSVTVRNPEEAFIASGTPDRNYGDGIVFVGYDPSVGFEASLVRFDLPDLPAGAIIQNAVFKAQEIGGEGANEIEVEVWQIHDPWGEHSVTWNTKPLVVQNSDVSEMVSVNEYVVWDVTPIVAGWYAGTGNGNQGLLMWPPNATSGSTQERVFDDNKFRLEINYQTETTPPTIAIDLPTANDAYWTNSSSVHLQGTAHDNEQLSQVVWYNQTSGVTGNAVGTSNWTSNVPLLIGVNRIEVQAVDASGNRSSDYLTVHYIAAPDNVIASHDLDGQVAISWDELPGSGYYYQVSRSDSEVGPKTIVSAWSPNIAAFDMNTEMGVDYYYWVQTASSMSGANASAYSNFAIGHEGEPDIRVDKASFDFGRLNIGQTIPETFTIFNDGVVDLVVSEASGLDAPFDVFPSNGSGSADDWTIPSGGSRPFTVVFAPVAGGPFTDNLVLRSNDPDGLPPIAVQGTGNFNPVATIDSISPNPAQYATDTVGFLGTGTDSDGSVLTFEWQSSLDGPLSSDEDFTMPAEELSLGEHTIAFRVIDGEGAASDWATVTLNVVPDETPPVGSVSMASAREFDGNPFTLDGPAVRITPSASDDSGGTVELMRVSYDGEIWQPWTAYSPDAFNLSVPQSVIDTAAGEITLYMQYRDIAGNESEIVSDTIPFTTILPIVTSTDDIVADDGATSLREAIMVASLVKEAVGFDESVYSPGPARILLSGAELRITHDIELLGPGASMVTIDGALESRVFRVDDGAEGDVIDVRISGLTITGGSTMGDGTDYAGRGGGILSLENLTLQDSVVSGNTADGSSNSGGGIYSRIGDLTVLNSTISGNTVLGYFGYGGAGIHNKTGNLTIDSTIITRNSSLYGGSGGGILSEGASLVVTDSQITDNSTGDINGRYAQGGNGGGIWTAAETTIAASSISRNTAVSGAMSGERGDGGGIWAGSSLVILDSTISGNTAGDAQLSYSYYGHAGSSGGGIWSSGATRIERSTISENSAGNGASGGQYPIPGGSGGSGGGIWASGELTIVGSAITTNTAGDGGAGGLGDMFGASGYDGGQGGSGGGIFAGNALTIASSVVSGNRAGAGGIGGNGQDSGANGAAGGAGGGILAGGTLVITDSTISDNWAGNGGQGGGGQYDGGHGGPGGAGGGISARDAVTIDGSTLTGNTAGTGGAGGWAGPSYYGGPGTQGGHGAGGGLLITPSPAGAESEITNTTISGNTTSGAGGGLSSATSLSIVGSRITGNRSVRSVSVQYDPADPMAGAGAATIGGGIHNTGSMQIIRSTISGNMAQSDTQADFGVYSASSNANGGGIYSSGTLTIVDSALTGNLASAHSYLNYGDGGSTSARGGGLFNAGTASLRNVTFSGNGADALTGTGIANGATANAEGGGIYDQGTMTIANGTVTANVVTSTVNSENTFGWSAVARGGGLVANGDALLTNTIVSQNSGLGDIVVDGVHWDPSVSDVNVAGVLSPSSTYNLVDVNGSGGLQDGVNGNIVGGDPGLGPLSDNGGSTQTHALLFGSPAIDAGDPGFTPPPDFDQRGAPFDRVFGGRIDMGAYERQTGDVDFDGDIDFDDIAALVLGLTDLDAYEVLYGAPPNANGDTDGDGDLDFDDIPGFAELVTSGLAASTPITEIGSLRMIAIANDHAANDRADGKFSTESLREASSASNLALPRLLALDSFVKQRTHAPRLWSTMATTSRDRELKDDQLATVWSDRFDWLKHKRTVSTDGQLS